MQANVNSQARLMGEQHLNQTKIVTAATALLVHERFVIVNSGAIMNLTLPSVAEARGLSYKIWLRTDGGDLTVVDKGDSVGWVNLVLADAGDTVLCISDGIAWNVMKLGVA